MPLTEKPKKVSKSRNLNVKICRNRGEEYTTEKTNKKMAARRDSPLVSNCNHNCTQRNLKCSELALEEREHVRRAFYDLADLEKQREWIARHIDLKTSGKNNSYYLPGHASQQKRIVCRALCLNTVGITTRQIRTVIKKIGSCGVIEPEKRGGRQGVNKDRDGELRKEVIDHIARYPRVESHYCRSSSSCQYLSSDLNAAIMHRMYKAEYPNGASIPFYRSMLEKLNLKFHRPKKDLCGICDSFVKASVSQKEPLQERYNQHIRENRRWKCERGKKKPK